MRESMQIDNSLMNQEVVFEACLPSGHTIQIFKYGKETVVQLVESGGYVISDTNLNKYEIKTLQSLIRG